jgi:hypothetical protein
MATVSVCHVEWGQTFAFYSNPMSRRLVSTASSCDSFYFHPFMRRCRGVFLFVGKKKVNNKNQFPIRKLKMVKVNSVRYLQKMMVEVRFFGLKAALC